MINSRVLSVAVAPVIRMYQHTQARKCRWGPLDDCGIMPEGVRSIAEVFPNRLCGVLRTEDADAGFQACLTAMEAGVHTIEITKTVPSCFDMIKGLIATTMGRYPVGVGTVWDPGAVKEAKQAGASFVVTPVVLPEVADACRQEDILCVLGALTPTEIYQARLAGAAPGQGFPPTPGGGPPSLHSPNGALRGGA